MTPKDRVILRLTAKFMETPRTVVPLGLRADYCWRARWADFIVVCKFDFKTMAAIDEWQYVELERGMILASPVLPKS